MINNILLYNSGGGLGDSIQLFPLILSLKNHFKNSDFYYLGAHENHFENKLKDFNIKIKTLNLDIPIIETKTDDIRSYHISSAKVNNVFGFYTKKKISDAVIEIQNAYNNNLISDPLNNSSYYNIKKMQELELV